MPLDINNTLSLYGASLEENNTIQKNGKILPVVLYQKGKRLYFEDSNGNKLFSGPIAENTICSFVEKFWYWERR